MKRILESAFSVVLVSLLAASSSEAFELNGFADITFKKCTKEACDTVLGEEGGRNGNFSFGELDFFVVHRTDPVDVLVELVVRHGDTIDLVRLIVGYTFSDALRFQAGRFHTPLWFWNVSFHHGVQIQPTINRPEFLKFEHNGGILPMHTVGVYLSGKVKTQAMAMKYGVMVGNGSKITKENVSVRLLPNNISDNNTGKSVAAHFAISPKMISGLEVGVSGHMARVESDNPLVAPVVDVDQTILSAGLTYDLENLRLMGEYISIKDNDNTTGDAGSNTSSAYYGLISYALTDKWVPYLVYENMSVKSEPGEDPFFIALRSLDVTSKDVTKTIGGIRYNISHMSSVKAEVRKVEWGDLDWNEYGVQWALAF